MKHYINNIILSFVSLVFIITFIEINHWLLIPTVALVIICYGINIAYLMSRKTIDREREYIICSAIWYKELSLIKPDVLKIRGFAPYNIDHGIVLCGWRHPNCMYQMVAITGLKSHEAGKRIEGFLTSKNRFVDREEAALIFKSHGGELTYSDIRLFSEDVY